MMKITFPYPGVAPLTLPNVSKISVLEPKVFSVQPEDEIAAVHESLQNPIGAPRLSSLARGKQNVLILIDDYTRNTPLYLILPEVLRELTLAGVKKSSIRLFVASGTHRAMTAEEKRKKVGDLLLSEYPILDHAYDDPTQLIQLPPTPGGTEVWVNRALMESDFVIGIGHIVPHRVAGFSGGGKIVQPGACGPLTTGQTHWLSARFLGGEVIGKANNPVRTEIDAVAQAAGLKYIVNAVLDGRGRLVSCFCGDPVKAFQAGASRAMEIFGAPLSELADIVIADSHPTNSEMWLAAKAIYAADLAVKPGGIIILVTPCPEGISVEWPQITRLGYRPYVEVLEMVKQGEIADLTMAAHLVHVGRVICEKATTILVSSGIDAETAEKIGFRWAATPQEALDLALERKGTNVHIAVLKNGGEVMPVVENRAS